MLTVLLDVQCLVAKAFVYIEIRQIGTCIVRRNETIAHEFSPPNEDSV